MTLTEALTEIKTSLAPELPGWDINDELIDWPKDKLVDLLYDNFQYSYVDMSTVVYSGRLSFVLYREYQNSYQDLLTALDTLLAWLKGFRHVEIAIGNNTDTLADVNVVDGTYDDITRFRVISITVPMEIVAD